MSREFGDYSGGGYFHNKISAALEDARGGKSDGAKLMALILKPLADMAWAVSSEEASDDSEPATVQAFFDTIHDLESAIQAIRYYTEPARHVAVNTLANILAKSAKVERVSNGKWSVMLPMGFDGDTKAVWDVRNQAICDVARLSGLTDGSYSLTWSGCSYSSSSRTITHYVESWDCDDRSYLRDKIRHLEERVAFLETTKSEANDDGN